MRRRVVSGVTRRACCRVAARRWMPAALPLSQAQRPRTITITTVHAAVRVARRGIWRRGEEQWRFYREWRRVMRGLQTGTGCQAGA